MWVCSDFPLLLRVIVHHGTMTRIGNYEPVLVRGALREWQTLTGKCARAASEVKADRSKDCEPFSMVQESTSGRRTFALPAPFRLNCNGGEVLQDTMTPQFRC
jgi:hypothetical protein